MRMTKIASAIALGLAATGNGAWAQSQGQTESTVNANDTKLEKVTVTATRRSTLLQDTSLSMSVLNGSQLEDHGVISVGTAVQLVPGVALTSGTPGQSDIIIRGVGSSASQQTLAGAVLNSTTATYLGQIPISSTARKTPDLRFIDMEQVEVLRGPQGTLYGASAMGGVVRYMPNRPDSSGFSGAVGSSVSSTKDGGMNYGLDGFLNIPLSKEAALRIVGYNYSNDGFIDVVGTSQDQHANTERTSGGRVALRLTPNSRATVDLTAAFSESKTGHVNMISSTYVVPSSFLTTPTVTPVSTDQLKVQHKMPTKDTSTVLGAEVNYKFDSSDATFVLAQKKADSFSSFESAEFVGLTAAHFGSTNPADAKTTSAEIRFASNAKNQFVDWLVGGYFENTDGHVSNNAISQGDPVLLGFFGSFVGKVTEQERQIKYKESSVFGELTMHLTPDLGLTAGIRHAKVDTNNMFISASPSASNFSKLGVDQSTSETVATYRTNVSYKLSKDVLLYSNIATGYRPGGFNPGASTPVDIPSTSFGSDNLVNYEIGTRTSWLNDRLTLNAALYRIDWDKMQTSVIRQTGAATFYSSTQNVGKAQIDGLELEAGFRATKNLRLSAAYSLSDARIVEAVALTSKVGDPLPGTPKNSSSLTVDWRNPNSSGGQYVASATYRNVGERLMALNSSVTMPAYNQVDLRAGIEMANGLDLSFYVNNATNEIPIYMNVKTAVPNFSYYAIGAPRTLGFTARYRF